MKLSEQLIELAEWWFIPTENEFTENDFLLHSNANSHMFISYGHEAYHGHSETDKTMYLCLFEAELQKDIEQEVAAQDL